jgi:15-cis-phytoene synthase
MDGGAYAQSVVRESDPDRFFATLFAPADKRTALFALYAFNAEVARVRDVVSEPIPGEIRLTWWREVIEGERAGEAAAHPVAGALMAAMRDYNLPAAALSRLVEARIFDLYDDPIATVTELEGYAGETASTLLRLASIVLAGGEEPGGADAAGHAGVAFAITGMLRSLPLHASRGQVMIPAEILARNGVDRDKLLSGESDACLLNALAEMRALARHHLGQAKAAFSGLDARAVPAFLPVALVEPYLRVMEARGFDPFRTAADVSQWRKQLTLWLASRRSVPFR